MKAVISDEWQVTSRISTFHSSLVTDFAAPM